MGPGDTTFYLSDGTVMAEKVMGSGGSIQWNNYLVAAKQPTTARASSSAQVSWEFLGSDDW
jgi:hypothetical protein